MPISRKKACLQCRTAKAKCSLDSPGCSRCAGRGLRCEYDPHGPPRRLQGARDQEPPSAPLPAPPPWAPLSAHSRVGDAPGQFQDLGAAVETDPRDLAPVDPALLLDCPDDMQVDWGMIEQLGSPGALDAITKTAAPSPPFEPAPVLSIFSEKAFAPAMPNLALPRALDSRGPPPVTAPSTGECCSPPPSAPGDGSSPSPTSSPSSAAELELRPRTSILSRRPASRTCLLTSVVLGQLASFPRRLIHGDRLPPFVAGGCAADESRAADCTERGRHVCLPGPLAVCAGLVREFYSRGDQNEAWVWRAVYAEQARLHAESVGYGHEALLQALQAVMVYIILQAQDAATIDRNDAGALIFTAVDLVVKISHTCDWRRDVAVAGRPDRREWLLLESTRRTVSLLYVIELLLEGIIGPTGAGCCEGFQAMPLPCARELWEAATNLEWRRSWDAHAARRRSDRPLLVVDLMGLRASTTEELEAAARGKGIDTKVLADLMRWCEGLDEFGTFVWTVVPFEQHRVDPGSAKGY